MSTNYQELAELYFHEYDQNSLEDPYEKKRRKVFKELAAAIITSEFPELEAQIAIAAWNLTAELAVTGNKGKGRRLKLDKIFYVYVLMDPRKPGQWIIDLPGGKIIELPFLPFYVGKGYGGRMKAHARHARAKPTPVAGEHKANTIRSLHRLGLEPIEKRVSGFSIEAVALMKEVGLVKAVGRGRNGPLTNLSDAGEGLSGYKPTEETKAKIAAKLDQIVAKRKATYAGKSQEELDAINEKNSLAHRGKKQSVETLEKRVAQLRGTTRPTEVGTKISASKMGHETSVETRAKQSAAKKGRPALNKGTTHTEETKAKMRAAKAAQPIKICEHCGTESKGTAFTRWHGDNCKFKKD
jgi:hypothetical protein